MGFFDGKTKKIEADPLAGSINSTGQRGLDLLRAGGDRLNDIYNQDPSGVVNSQINIENRLMRGAADDATRRTRSLIAQRGLSNSSIGLGQEVNQARDLNNKLALNNASGMQRLRDMSIQNAQGQMNIGNSLFAPKINATNSGLQMQTVKYKTGGMGQLFGTALGAGIGGYLGGTKGAQAGAGIGNQIGGAAQYS